MFVFEFVSLAVTSKKKKHKKKHKNKDKTKPTQSSDKKNGRMLLPGGRLFESQ